MSNRAGPEGSLVIERIFDAPVEAVWALWTDPEQFAAWYGPNGASIPVADMDVRVGGLRRVGMEVQTSNGPMSMWFTGEYREIVDNRRLAYTESRLATLIATRNRPDPRPDTAPQICPRHDHWRGASCCLEPSLHTRRIVDA